jgi:hypothetical protein
MKIINIILFVICILITSLLVILIYKKWKLSESFISESIPVESNFIKLFDDKMFKPRPKQKSKFKKFEKKDPDMSSGFEFVKDGDTFNNLATFNSSPDLRENNLLYGFNHNKPDGLCSASSEYVFTNIENSKNKVKYSGVKTKQKPTTLNLLKDLIMPTPLANTNMLSKGITPGISPGMSPSVFYNKNHNMQHKNTSNNLCLTDTDTYPDPPSFVYASPFDDLIKDKTIVINGLKSEAHDARLIPRIVSKYVYPYIPENGEIPLVNTGIKPWYRHPINSIPRNLLAKYDSAYYYELENDIYMKAFYKTFKTEEYLLPEVYKNKSLWSEIFDASTSSRIIEDGYNSFIYYLQDVIYNTTNFILKEDPTYSKKIQIVHDIFSNYRTHNKEYFSYLIRVEVLLYRENKYNAKHIGMHVIITNNSYNPIITMKPKVCGPSANGPSPYANGPSPNANKCNPNELIYTTDFFDETSNGPSSGPGPGPGPSPTSYAEDRRYKKNDWSFYIIEAKLIGDVPEDMIILHPIVAKTDYDTYDLEVDRNPMNKPFIKNYAKNYTGIAPKTKDEYIYPGIENTQGNSEIDTALIHDFIRKTNDKKIIIEDFEAMSSLQAKQKFDKLNNTERIKVMSALPAQSLAKVLVHMNITTVRTLLKSMNDHQKSLETVYYLKQY